MPEPKPLTTFAETMVKTHYGRRTLRWIGDRLGCSPATVLSYAEQLGLWKPTADEKRGIATAPRINSLAPPPSKNWNAS